MADDMPYMLSIENLNSILDKIRTAGTPPKFTHEFLKTSLGFTASGDRGVIKVFPQLGFLSTESVPTARYNEFRQADTSSRALAVGLREGWAPIFLADQQAHTRTSSQLKEIFKNVSGKAEAVAEKMAATFKSLASRADFTTGATTPPPVVKKDDTTDEESREEGRKPRGRLAPHHDVHLHLPPSSDG